MKLAHLTRLLIAAACLAPAAALAQDKPAPQPQVQTQTTASASTAPPVADKPAFKSEELEQMLAPIALYPDSLLSQVFMASTYPVEVVEADRWVKANPSLKGDALAKQLEAKPWDPSVRSLVNFPQVLAMMSENLSTTVKIGDAFIGQQKDVMDTVQRLRAKAQTTGNLKSSEQQTVSTQTADTGAQVIVIQSPSPEVIYVPQYNPTVVYGTWPYPSYPPYPYYPPGYVASNVLSFGLGVACGAAWGYAWGNCNWGHGDVDIDINRNNNFNTNIDRSKFKGAGVNGGKGSWNHDPAHRQGAAYRNSASAQKVGAGPTSTRATQTRSEYRGKAEAGRSDIARGGADSVKGRTPPPSARPSSTGSTRAPSSATDRGAFSGADRGGAATREASNRGNASRSSSPSRSAPARSSGGSRGGRGGGGRR